MPAPLRDIPDDAVELIKSFEGIPDGDPRTVNIDPYLDPVGIWTIGWGHAIPAPGGGWLRGASNAALARSLYPGGITKAQAELLLRGDLVDTGRDVERLVTVDLDDEQFGALVSFTFNLGAGSLGQSTLLKKLNAGDFAAAADQFLAWNKGRVNGQLVVLPGLARRRTAERALFLGEDWRAAGAVRGAARPAPARPVVARKAAKRAAPKAPRTAAGPAVKKVARKAGKKPAKLVAEKAVAIRPRGRTTTAKGLPPAPSARRRGPRTPR
jgi:lysozyme